MEEPNKPKNTKDIQDFEMGGAEAERSSDEAQKQPIINKYNKSASTTGAAAGTASVASSAVPPKASVNPSAPPPVTQQTTQQVRQTGALRQKFQGGDPVARKKALLGCLGAFGSVMLIFLILSFIFLAQSGAESSPIAKLLGVNQDAFINGLITFIHLIFILVSLAVFVLTMVGLFKASMAKKGDKETKRAGLKMSMISGSALLVILIIWGFVYVYLDAKRTQTAPEFTDPIVTAPEITTELNAPIEVKFDSTRVPIDKGKYQRISDSWDFGDESASTGQIVSHIYEAKGTYDVKLTVTVKDKNSGELLVSGEYHKIVSITNQALAAVFTADPQSGEVPLTVKFDGSASYDPDGYLDRYEWDLDNDKEFDDAEGEKTEKTFDKIGRYKVSLRVTSTTGEYDVEEKEIIVQQQENPAAVISIVDEPEEFEIGVSYVFKADNSTSPNGKIESYEWEFSDTGEISDTKTVSHVFSAPGTYEITLKVKDELEEIGEQVMTIVISAPEGTPEPVISIQPELPENAVYLEGTVPFTVAFDARQSTDSDNNIVDYNWDFNNDGKSDAYGEQVTYVFREEGTFTVVLSVIDADDNKGMENLVVKVVSQGIIADLKADKIEGNIPLTVNFDAGGSTYQDGQITSYQWNFGDGTSPKISAAKISHKFTSIGTFTATVTVIGSDNTKASKSLTITVREIPLAACFVSVFEQGKAPLETTFDPGCSTGTIINYFWDFGDGSTSTSAKPTHIFEEAGEYKVVLEASDAENTVDQAELTITVTD